MKNLLQYLTTNKTLHKEIDDDYIEINNEKFNLVYPTEDDKLFSKDFELLTEYQCDNYVYEFGGKYYWENNKDILSPKLNPLKYIGLTTSPIENFSFLGIHGTYEILNGSRLYSDWIKKAKFLGIKTLGICEKNTLAGTLKFQLECHKNKIKSIIGATYTIFREKEDFRYDIKVYVKNEIGWKNILAINKEVLVINSKFIHEDKFLELAEGLILVLDPKSISLDKLHKSFCDTSDDIYYQLDTVEFKDNEIDKEYLLNIKKYYLSMINPISICDAYYLDQEDLQTKQSLNTISGVREAKSDNQYFKDREDYLNELSDLIQDEDVYYDLFDRLIANEKHLCDSCDFQIEVGQKYLPKYIMTAEEQALYGSNIDMFWALIEQGMKDKVPEEEIDRYLDRIGKEYEIVEYGGLQDYFLINWEQSRWCEKSNILTGLSRGSAAGFQLSHLLDITKINPFDYDLIAERFLTKERAKHKIADIDIDHEQGRKEEVKLHHIEKYGFDQCCSVGTYGTLQIKGALKDLAKINNIPYDEVNYISTIIDIECKEWSDIFKIACKKPRLKEFIQTYSDLFNDLQLALNAKRNTSIHASAFVITPSDKTIYEWMPVKKVEENLVSEWEGVELEDAGFLKQDILGLLQLDKFHLIFDLIRQNKDIDLSLTNIPLDDKKTLSYFGKGWSEDVFQFGARGLSGYCKILNPQSVDDLIATIALYRPGPMENNFHNEYILRKNGEREVEYFSGTEEITKNTYGIYCYQEQVMQVCQKLAGFDLAETDDIRKAMGKKKAEVLEPYKIKFVDRSIENGFVREEMEELWETMEKFAGYAFNLSHAAAYAITGYISQYLKANYPIEFWSAAFQFAKEKDHANYINEINQIGEINIMPVDINKSRDNVFTDFETKTIFWPFESIKQCGEKAATQLIEERDSNGQYFSFEEFLDRHKFKGSKVGKAIIENLILSGAFDLLENVTTNNGRLNLIQKFHRIAKVKLDPLKDIFTLNKDLLKEDWWWTLQQKRLSGIAFFDYKTVIKKYLEKGFILKPKDYQNEEFAEHRKKVLVAGYISEIEERESKKKGKWARLTIETNYTFLNVTIWSDHWKQLSHLDLLNKNKCVLLMSGQLVWDSFKNCNILQSCDDSEVFILE